LCLGTLDWNEQDVYRQVFRVVAALYLVCALLRLARFNLENLIEAPAAKRFKGLPSPGAAGCLAALAIFRSQCSEISGRLNLDQTILMNSLKLWAPLGGLLVAVLMVSRFPYPHLTKNLRGRRNFASIVQAILVVAVLFLSPVLTGFLLFWVYALLTPTKSILVWAIRRGKRLPDSEPTHTLS
jgi:phosphatidylserine synthase